MSSLAALLTSACIPDAAHAEARRSAFEHYQPPKPKQEAWRFTDTRLLNLPTRLAQVHALAVDALPQIDGAARLVLLDGVWQAQLSDPLPAGLTLELDSHPSPLPGLAQHPYALLNQALYSQTLVLKVAAGCALEQPVHVLCFSQDPDSLRLPRLRVEIGAGAQLTLIEEHCGQGAYYNCPLTELQLSSRAHLHYQRVQNDALAAVHLASVRAQLASDAQLQFASLCLGSKLGRCDLHIALDSGAQLQLDGLVLADSGQSGEHYLRIEHTQPQASSQQRMRAILQGEGRSVFDGMIYVAPKAQKTDASQQSRSLLLSRKAKAHTQPRLEIYADDVKCAHGATVGFLDPDALFYLRARGIALADAQRLLVQAFAQDTFNHLSPQLRQRLEALLSARLRAHL